MMTAESRLTLDEFLHKLADELDYPPRCDLPLKVVPLFELVFEGSSLVEKS
jgi:hypothetical protein